MEFILSRSQYKYNLIVFVLVLSISYAVKKYFLISGFASFIVFFGGAALYIVYGYGALAKKSASFRFLYSFFPVLLLFVYAGVVSLFGEFDFVSIVFHLSMGLEGGIPENSAKYIFRFALSYLGVVVAFWFLINKGHRFLALDRTLFVPLLLINPLVWSVGSFFIGNPYDDRLLKAYSAPDHLQLLVTTKKNMIIIYAESTERTFGEIAGGDKIFTELKELAASGLEVKGLAQAKNTGWSMAGFVASQCGVPLQPHGLLSGNMFDKQQTFFAGIVCLSDLLKKNDYHVEFLNGADHGFAGMTTFLNSHQFDQTYGVHNIEAPSDYRNDWGHYDDTVFEHAQNRVRLLNQSGKPYVMSVATIAAHFPSGHPTRSCEQAFPNNKLPQILFSVKCTGYEINRFIKTLRHEGLLENTVVVIVSDHLMMKNDYEEQLNQKQRLNYFAVIGDNNRPQLLERHAAMFDVFPTLLDLLGFSLPDGQAGLGVSLLSENKTLFEQYGAGKINDQIGGDRLLARKIWAERPAF
ncbi:sulfatase-like hydrolase/transferase [Bacillus subtilis]|uniref:sulfatase-like hydrolase/transferase n=1 Tax=Pseudochrobactrum asaccharolyticum TaxID=354351 RepID=UPI001F001800|nr:sulfatase-like hydrolase/transferase [Pseudochrobactrum asaccharolyticum]MCF7645731.1 sulfatase-like hydrolase/transferase [Pseudochrobactrum asaccharolyticum]MCF7671204.1 sulfatase-like hydrolase/transferase [Bacillus subtilis]